MLLDSLIVIFLLATSVSAAPTSEITQPSLEDTHDIQEDDPLDTSESGHFRRRRVWRKLLKHLVGLGSYGLGSYGLGGYGLGGYGLGGHGLKEGGGHAHKHHHNEGHHVNEGAYGPPAGGYPHVPHPPAAAYPHPVGFPVYQDYYGVTDLHGPYPLDSFHQFDLGGFDDFHLQPLWI